MLQAKPKKYLKHYPQQKMYSLNEEKKECAFGNMDIWFFWQVKKAKNVVCFISDAGIRGIICH